LNKELLEVIKMYSICPYCKAKIKTDNITLQDKIIKCPYCDATIDLEKCEKVKTKQSSKEYFEKKYLIHCPACNGPITGDTARAFHAGEKIQCPFCGLQFDKNTKDLEPLKDPIKLMKFLQPFQDITSPSPNLGLIQTNKIDLSVPNVNVQDISSPIIKGKDLTSKYGFDKINIDDHVNKNKISTNVNISTNPLFNNSRPNMITNTPTIRPPTVRSISTTPISMGSTNIPQVNINTGHVTLPADFILKLYSQLIALRKLYNNIRLDMNNLAMSVSKLREDTKILNVAYKNLKGLTEADYRTIDDMLQAAQNDPNLPEDMRSEIDEIRTDFKKLRTKIKNSKDIDEVAKGTLWWLGKLNLLWGLAAGTPNAENLVITVKYLVTKFLGG